MQWSDIRDWEASTLSDEYDALSSKERKADDWGHEVISLNDNVTWEGEARDAAEKRLQQIEKGIATYVVGVRAMKDATSSMQDSMREVNGIVTDATTQAKNNGFSIADDCTVTDDNPISWTEVTVDGVVSYTIGGGMGALAGSVFGPVGTVAGSVLGGSTVSSAVLADIVATRETSLKQCADKVNDAVEKAVAADQAYADALNKIALGQVEPGDKSLSEILDGPLPMPANRQDSQAVAAWWDSLTPEQQQELIDNDYKKPPSERIGNMDGVDGWARDAANRKSLANDLDPLKEKKENGVALTDEEQKKYDELKALEDAAAPSEYQPKKQLLLYDPVEPGEDQDQLHAAVSVGDVDTAENVAVQTGGLDTSVGGNVKEYTHNMENIANSAGGNTAMVTYFGYDTPHVSTGDPDQRDLSVTNTDRAAAGGRNLANFLEGLHDSRQGEGEAGDPRLTAIGHSYGSTTTGYALTQVRDGVVDAAVFYGSPGIPATDVSELNVPSDSVYAIRNEGDVINGVPNGGLVPNRPGYLPGFNMTETTDPMNMDGIQHLRTNQYAPGWKDPVGSHTNYFDNNDYEGKYKEIQGAHPDWTREQVMEELRSQTADVPDSQQDVAAVVNGTYNG